MAPQFTVLHFSSDEFSESNLSLSEQHRAQGLMPHGIYNKGAPRWQHRHTQSKSIVTKVTVGKSGQFFSPKKRRSSKSVSPINGRRKTAFSGHTSSAVRLCQHDLSSKTVAKVAVSQQCWQTFSTVGNTHLHHRFGGGAHKGHWLRSVPFLSICSSTTTTKEFT